MYGGIAVIYTAFSSSWEILESSPAINEWSGIGWGDASSLDFKNMCMTKLGLLGVSQCDFSNLKVSKLLVDWALVRSLWRPSMKCVSKEPISSLTTSKATFLKSAYGDDSLLSLTSSTSAHNWFLIKCALTSVSQELPSYLIAISICWSLKSFFMMREAIN